MTAVEVRQALTRIMQQAQLFAQNIEDDIITVKQQLVDLAIAYSTEISTNEALHQAGIEAYDTAMKELKHQNVHLEAQIKAYDAVTRELETRYARLEEQSLDNQRHHESVVAQMEAAKMVAREQLSATEEKARVWEKLLHATRFRNQVLTSGKEKDDEERLEIANELARVKAGLAQGASQAPGGNNQDDSGSATASVTSTQVVAADAAAVCFRHMDLLFCCGDDC